MQDLSCCVNLLGSDMLLRSEGKPSALPCRLRCLSPPVQHLIRFRPNPVRLRPCNMPPKHHISGPELTCNCLNQPCTQQVGNLTINLFFLTRGRACLLLCDPFFWKGKSLTPLLCDPSYKG